jgi:predicted transcriptional regulator
MDTKRNRIKVLNDIINTLIKKEYSIAELSKELQMKRTTLIYYLGLLKSEGWINLKRIEKKQKGRPTIIKLKLDKLKQDCKGHNIQMQVYSKKMAESQFTNKILYELNRNKKMTLEQISKETSKIVDKDNLNNVKTSTSLNWLMVRNFIKNSFEITPEGKRFIKENKDNLIWKNN